MSLQDYLLFDANSDPGTYGRFYQNLPSSLDALCDLISKQFVHPWDGSEQPAGRKYEPRQNYRAQDMLAQLEQLNPAGLIMERTLDQRLIASCRENALLLTSILKYQGIPSRVRAGWVKYVSSDKTRYVDHWVSEVWHEKEKRWFLVDTNPKRIDLPRNEIQFAGKAWLQLRSGQAIPHEYRVDDDLFYVRLNFGHDFNAILGTAPHYWEAPPLFHIKMAEMQEWQLALLDQLAPLLEDPDHNIADLQQLQKDHAELQGLESAWPVFEQTIYR